MARWRARADAVIHGCEADAKQTGINSVGPEVGGGEGSLAALPLAFGTWSRHDRDTHRIRCRSVNLRET